MSAPPTAPQGRPPSKTLGRLWRRASRPSTRPTSMAPPSRSSGATCRQAPKASRRCRWVWVQCRCPAWALASGCWRGPLGAAGVSAAAVWAAPHCAWLAPTALCCAGLTASRAVRRRSCGLLSSAGAGLPSGTGPAHATASPVVPAMLFETGCTHPLPPTPCQPCLPIPLLLTAG